MYELNSFELHVSLFVNHFCFAYFSVNFVGIKQKTLKDSISNVSTAVRVLKDFSVFPTVVTQHTEPTTGALDKQINTGNKSESVVSFVNFNTTVRLQSYCVC